MRCGRPEVSGVSPGSRTPHAGRASGGLGSPSPWNGSSYILIPGKTTDLAVIERAGDRSGSRLRAGMVRFTELVATAWYKEAGRGCSAVVSENGLPLWGRTVGAVQA